MEDLVKRKELAKLLNVTQQTIINWDKSGTIKRVMIGKQIYYRKSEILKGN